MANYSEASVVAETENVKQPTNYEEVYNQLIKFFKTDTAFDDIAFWINENVSERREKMFIKTLATAVFRHSIGTDNSLIKTNLEDHYRLLRNYVKDKDRYQFYCLEALHALIIELQNPSGLLLAICDKLYTEDIFSPCSFVMWEASKDYTEQEDDGTSLQTVAPLFEKIKKDAQHDFLIVSPSQPF